MEENSNQRLHSIVLSDSSESEISKESKKLNEDNIIMDKPFIRCFSNKWCFQNLTPCANKTYDEKDYLCCTYLDCCTCCLEFHQKKSKCCKNNVVCFMCCCSITFH